MKTKLDISLLPKDAVLITCSSHEGRCLGLLERVKSWRPRAAALFHYDDENPRREEQHKAMKDRLSDLSVLLIEAVFTEANAVKSMCDNMEALRRLVGHQGKPEVVLDISVFTKRHLLMMLRWLDDYGLWDGLTVVYTEPDDYDVSHYVPLSFGVKSIQQIPGFSATPDLSRPIQLIMFLGYEGDRALAVYEHVQPNRTSLLIPHPPYKPEWEGRTEEFNSQLLAVAGNGCTQRVDAIDPDAACEALKTLCGPPLKRSHDARIVVPLGTKPQTLGIYYYVRQCADSPAVLYASPLRHNHEFFSHGIGRSWILKSGTGI
jgi:hypothetical protein